MLSELWERGEAVTVDLLGEKVVRDAEADRYAARVMELVDAMARATPAWPTREQLERDPWGPLPRTDVSIKPTALSPLLHPAHRRGGAGCRDGTAGAGARPARAVTG